MRQYKCHFEFDRHVILNGGVGIDGSMEGKNGGVWSKRAEKSR